MTLVKKALTAALTIVFVVSLFAVSGCTKYASPDDLQKLDESKKAAVSAEKELQSVKSERMQVESELAVKQQELKDAEGELEQIKANN